MSVSQSGPATAGPQGQASTGMGHQTQVFGPQYNNFSYLPQAPSLTGEADRPGQDDAASTPPPPASGRLPPRRPGATGGEPGGFSWTAWFRLRQTRQAALTLAVALLVPLLARLIPGTPPPAPGPLCPGLHPPGSHAWIALDRDGHGHEICYGYTDRISGGTGFGDGDVEDLQRKVLGLSATGPASAADLTVIWFGQLSAHDPRPHASELQQLQGLMLSEQREGLRGTLRVVLADAGPDMVHASDVAGQLAAHRRDFGGRVVAIGGGDSRAVTRLAINTLLDAGIPFIAPTLTGDVSQPGAPFVERPGYLQMSPPNRRIAATVLDRIARYTPKGTQRRVIVYARDDASDEYVTSLATDLQLEGARSSTVWVDPNYARSPDDLDDSICASQPPGTVPAAVFFADRPTRFAPVDGATRDSFVSRVTMRCAKKGGPALVVADDAVTRFMTDDGQRRTVPDATWPLAYVVKGSQCWALEHAENNPQAEQLLNLARSMLQSCTHSGDKRLQLGESVSLLWDAVALADALLPVGPRAASDNRAFLQSLRTEKPFLATDGPITVSNGQVADQPPAEGQLPIGIQIYCVTTVAKPASDADDTGRSIANCDHAFSLGAGNGSSRPVTARS